MNNIIVIGGAGYLGTKLINSLEINKDNKVFSYDLNHSSVDKSKLITYIDGDILDFDFLCKSLKNMDVVFLKAGLLGNPMYSMDNKYFDNYFDLNLIGAYNIVKACKINNIKKIIYSSSVAIYGEQSESIFAKENIFPKPRNFYGFSKVNAERLLSMYCKQNEIKLIILRYPRVRSEESKDVVNSFIVKVLKNESIQIAGNPHKQIEFVDVADVINSNLLALDTDVEFGQFNISNGEPITLHDLFGLILSLIKKTGVTYEVIENEKSIEPLVTRLDMSDAFEILGYYPTVNLVSMITKTINYINKEEKNEYK